jgi:hypothetical protein
MVFYTPYIIGFSKSGAATPFMTKRVHVSARFGSALNMGGIDISMSNRCRTARISLVNNILDIPEALGDWCGTRPSIKTENYDTPRA